MDKRQKILIVDDAELNRDILKEILGETYTYLEAENGNQAIQMIGENIGIDLASFHYFQDFKTIHLWHIDI